MCFVLGIINIVGWISWCSKVSVHFSPSISLPGLVFEALLIRPYPVLKSDDSFWITLVFCKCHFFHVTTLSQFDLFLINIFGKILCHISELEKSILCMEMCFYQHLAVLPCCFRSMYCKIYLCFHNSDCYEDNLGLTMFLLEATWVIKLFDIYAMIKLVCLAMGLSTDLGYS